MAKRTASRDETHRNSTVPTYRFDANRLQAAALAKGFGTPEGLRRATGHDGDHRLHRSTVTKVWRGQPVSFSTVEAIAKVLGCKPADLLVAGEKTEVLVPRRSGIQTIYAGESDNVARNEAKQKAIQRTNGNVTLLARTGYSYLTSIGQHGTEVFRFLSNEEDNSFTAVILNPYCTGAIEVYLTWIRSCGSPDFVAPYLARQIGKLKNSLDGFRDLRAEFGDRVELRLTSFDISMTILATIDTIFMEPYFQAHEEKRNRQGLVGIEIESRCDGDLGQLLGPSKTADEGLSHLDFFLTHSIPYDDWRAHQALFASHFSSLLDLLAQTGELKQRDAQEMSRAVKSLSA